MSKGARDRMSWYESIIDSNAALVLMPILM